MISQLLLLLTRTHVPFHWRCLPTVCALAPAPVEFLLGSFEHTTLSRLVGLGAHSCLATGATAESADGRGQCCGCCRRCAVVFAFGCFLRRVFGDCGEPVGRAAIMDYRRRIKRRATRGVRRRCRRRRDCDCAIDYRKIRRCPSSWGLGFVAIVAQVWTRLI